MRNTIGWWLTAAVVVSGLLAAGSPAIAAETAPSAATHALSTQQQARAVAPKVSGVKAVPAGVGDSGQICLTNAPSRCIKTNGTGNQVTITSNPADDANFTVVRNNLNNYQWQDGNGNCLREGTGGVVKIENGPCSNSDKTDWWTKVASNAYIDNLSNDAEMYTKGDASGDDVWASTTTPPSGSWVQWKVPT